MSQYCPLKPYSLLLTGQGPCELCGICYNNQVLHLGSKHGALGMQASLMMHSNLNRSILTELNQSRADETFSLD